MAKVEESCDTIDSRFSMNEDNDEVIEETLREYEKELLRIFWFPAIGKYIAWGLSIIIVISSFIILAIFGLMFGTTKCFIWLSTVFFALVITIFIFQPIKMLIVALFSTFALKFQEAIAMKEFDICIMKNPADATIKKFVTNYRTENAFLYEVTSEELLKKNGLQQQIRYNLELRLLFIDIILYVLFMVALYFIVFQNKSEMEYYSNEAVKDLIIRGVYTESRPLFDVHNYDELMDYINRTLIPSLVMLYRDMPEISGQPIPMPPIKPKPPTTTAKPGRMRSVRENPWLEEDHGTTQDISEKTTTESTDQTKQRNREGRLVTAMKHRAWTLNRCLKLFGTIRARQHRVHNETCRYHPDVKVRHFLCAQESNYYNLDTQNFAIDWRPWRPTEPQKGWDDMQPWSYMDWWDTGSTYKIGRLGTYPGGGYILTIGKTIINAKLAMDYIHYFRWVDHYTRVVFLEFTLYSVNTNIFNVVSLIFEKAAHDIIVPSYYIHTAKFLFIHNEVWALGFFLFCIFVILVMISYVREYYRMRETSVETYFTHNWSILDFSILILATLTVAFYIVREYYVGLLLRRLERSAHNAFVSFQFVAYWSEVFMYVAAVLIALSTIKLIHLLRHKVLFHQLCQIFSISIGQISAMMTVLLVLVIAFSMYFHSTMYFMHETFSRFWDTGSTLTSWATGLNNEFPIDFPNMTFLSLVFFIIFGFVFTIIMVSYFWAIFYRSVYAMGRQVFWDRYSLYNYTKYKLFGKKLKTPETRIHYDVIDPYILSQCDPPSRITEVRLQGMRHIVLSELTGEDHSVETMCNVAGLVFSENDQRIATDDHYRVVWNDDKRRAVPESRLDQMYFRTREMANLQGDAHLTHK